MTNEEKERLEVATKRAVTFTKAQSWPKWVKIAVVSAICAAAGAVSVLYSSCTEVTPQQVQDVHALYHVVSGQPCIFVLDDVK